MSIKKTSVLALAKQVNHLNYWQSRIIAEQITATQQAKI